MRCLIILITELNANNAIDHLPVNQSFLNGSDIGSVYAFFQKQSFNLCRVNYPLVLLFSKTVSCIRAAMHILLKEPCEV
jgi:hypothetical protein